MNTLPDDVRHSLEGRCQERSRDGLGLTMELELGFRHGHLLGAQLLAAELLGRRSTALC